MVAARRRAASVTGWCLSIQRAFYGPARRPQYRRAACELFARPGGEFFDRPAVSTDSEPRARAGVLCTGRLAPVQSPDRQRRTALHAELSVIRTERSISCLQSRYGAARIFGT